MSNPLGARVRTRWRTAFRYRLFLYTLALSAATACAQENSTPSPNLIPTPPVTFSPSADSSSAETADSTQLPDAPSAVAAPPTDVVVAAKASWEHSGDGIRQCGVRSSLTTVHFDPKERGIPAPACTELIYPYQRFLDTDVAIPMTWQQKGYAALHQFTDPANFMTIAGISAINIAADSSTAYGPGFKGWGKLTGVSLLEDATGEFFGTFAIPSLTHQDPRYRRMPDASIPRRILNAVSQTYIAYNDNGTRGPNYGVWLTYPIASEIANLYVPGIQSNGPSTVKRILIGYSLEPVNDLVTEFLPDLARHVHIRIIFVQNILNNVAANQSSL